MKYLYVAIATAILSILVGLPFPKIREEHLIDMFALENYSEDFIGDVVFCCIGTTKTKTPDKIMYSRIDHGIPIAAARLSKKKQDRSVYSDVNDGRRFQECGFLQ